MPLVIPLVAPDFDAVAGATTLRSIVGALLTYSLIISVLMLIVCGTTWALAVVSGNWSGASRARTGVLVALGGAAATGAALTWANELLHLGSSL